MQEWSLCVCGETTHPPTRLLSDAVMKLSSQPDPQALVPAQIISEEAAAPARQMRGAIYGRLPGEGGFTPRGQLLANCRVVEDARRSTARMGGRRCYVREAGNQG